MVDRYIWLLLFYYSIGFSVFLLKIFLLCSSVVFPVIQMIMEQGNAAKPYVYIWDFGFIVYFWSGEGYPIKHTPLYVIRIRYENWHYYLQVARTWTPLWLNIGKYCSFFFKKFLVWHWVRHDRQFVCIYVYIYI